MRIKHIVILLLCLCALQSFAVTVTRTAAGNWGDANWSTGSAPVAGQDCALAGYTVTLIAGEVAIPVGGGSLNSITSTGTAGQIAVPANVVGSMSISATTITAGTNANGIIYITGAAPAATVTITYTTLTGGSGSGAAGWKSTSTCSVVDSGSLVGGTASTAYGGVQTGGGSYTHTGNITGGSDRLAYGMYNYTGTCTLNSCNLLWGNAAPFVGTAPTWNNATNANYYQAPGGTKMCPQLLDHQILSGVVNGDVVGVRTDCAANKALTTSGNYGDPASPTVGTNVLPATTDVRNGTAVGVSPAAGSLVVPAAGGVAVGVTYDNGTAGTRVDCPAEQALTTSGNYGDPASPIVGTNVLPGVADVREGVAVGISPAVGTLVVNPNRMGGKVR